MLKRVLRVLKVPRVLEVLVPKGLMVLVPKVLMVLVPMVLVVLVPMVLVVPMVLAGCSDLRVKVGVYDNLDEARAAGAIAAGWVPDALPKSTSDLREGHLPDGRYWGAFTFGHADEAAVRALVGSEITSGTLTCDPPGRLEWWPRIVLSPVKVEQVRSTGFQIYRGADARTYVVNWGQSRVYYWH